MQTCETWFTSMSFPFTVPKTVFVSLMTVLIIGLAPGCPNVLTNL